MVKELQLGLFGPDKRTEIIENQDSIHRVAKAPEQAVELIMRLIHKGHLSLARHAVAEATQYFKLIDDPVLLEQFCKLLMTKLYPSEKPLKD